MSEIFTDQSIAQEPFRSLSLIGEDSPVKFMPIREFKYSTNDGPYEENYHEIVPRLNDFLNQDVDETVNTIYSEVKPFLSRKENEASSHSAGYSTYDKLKLRLIAPAIKTGNIVSLQITKTDAESLPKSMVNKFARSYYQSFSEPHIKGYDSFYVMSARLKLGREIASVACGVCIAPYDAGVKTYSHRVGFKSWVEKFGVRDTEDLKIWRQSINESTMREIQAKNNPLHGGLMNPR